MKSTTQMAEGKIELGEVELGGRRGIGEGVRERME